jgi:nitroreductase
MSAPTEAPATSANAAALLALLQQHRSIRRYDAARALDPAWVDQLLQAALQGSSSSGNLNLVSVVKTSDPARKSQLRQLHFDQPMVDEAPLLLTFCADSFRTRQWLAQRQARAGFADFISWHVASFDAIILAQSAALAFEAQGLGICYMGTTLHSMGAIAEFLELPENCLPVTSLVVGWPAEKPAQRDRLPARAWIHAERYQRPTAAAIADAFGEREVRGWQRYRDLGPEMVERMAQHGIASLAQFYTSKIKYDPDRFAQDSAELEALLRARGFL